MPTFISHDMDDKTEYARLVNALNDAGVEHWDPKTMRPGVSLRQQLIESIDKCGTCVFLATRNSVQSRWCGAELGAFWSAGKKVVVEAGKYSPPPRFKLASGKQMFEEPYPDDRRAVVAIAPQGLTVKGRVLALGSWDFRSHGIQSHNDRFLTATSAAGSWPISVQDRHQASAGTDW